MRKYIIVRVIQAFLTSLFIVTLVFILVRVSGSPLTWLVNPRAPVEYKQKVAERYGLDKSMIIQYQRYLINIVQGKFGDSYVYKKPALEVIWSRVPASFQLSMAGIFIALLTAIPIGVYSAVKKGSVVDIAGRWWAFLGMSAPPFLVGVLLILLFSVKLGLLPPGGSGGIKHLIMPAATLGWLLAAGIARITRSSMLNVLEYDYITMGRAKGLHEQMVIWKHAFKNASIPVVTLIMLLMIILLSGEIVIENVFTWPGLGRLMMTSTLNRDYPVVQALVILICFTFVMISLVADILYAYLNPKIRYQ